LRSGEEPGLFVCNLLDEAKVRRAALVTHEVGSFVDTDRRCVSVADKVGSWLDRTDRGITMLRGL
jgi:hypothetical protein